MPNQTNRKARWCPERMRAYVLRDGIRYYAPAETVVSAGEGVRVINPTDEEATVCCAGLRETWRVIEGKVLT